MATSLQVRLLQIGNYRNVGTKPLYGIKGPFYIEFKIQSGRKKISYIMQEAGTTSGNHRLDIRFETITKYCIGTTSLHAQLEKGGTIKQEDELPLLELELSETPTFLQEVNGKYIKGEDFTGGQASHYRVHVLVFYCKLDMLVKAVDTIFSLVDQPIPLCEKSLEITAFSQQIPLCDNDEENIALLYCDECKGQYCRECDEVIHKHYKKRIHFRKPLTGPEAKKRKNVGKCRCGSGAKRDPTTVCITKRCPCFAEGRGCFSCGCKSCSNPYPNPNEDFDGFSTEIPSSKKQKLSSSNSATSSESSISSSAFSSMPSSLPSPAHSSQVHIPQLTGLNIPSHISLTFTPISNLLTVPNPPTIPNMTAPMNTPIVAPNLTSLTSSIYSSPPLNNNTKEALNRRD